MARRIRKIVNGRTQYDGAGVKVTKLLSHPDVYDFDPFLMLDAYDSRDPEEYEAGFPWHPHRGMETVTYLVSGEMEHGDSLGREGKIYDGSCQWITTGSGIVHQEMPRRTPHMCGVQIWINLPRSSKMTRPKYEEADSHSVYTVMESGATVRVIAGTYKGMRGPLSGGRAGASFIDVSLAPDASWSCHTGPDTTVFAYTLSGMTAFDDAGGIPRKRCVLFESGDRLSALAGPFGARFFLLEARPIREPIAWGHSIVMNTEDELHEAFSDLHEGRFVKK